MTTETGVRIERDGHKWWVVVNEARISDHMTRDAAATAANNHIWTRTDDR